MDRALANLHTKRISGVIILGDLLKGLYHNKSNFTFNFSD